MHCKFLAKYARWAYLIRFAISLSASRWLSVLTMGWLFHKPATVIVDNAPFDSYSAGISTLLVSSSQLQRGAACSQHPASGCNINFFREARVRSRGTSQNGSAFGHASRFDHLLAPVPFRLSFPLQNTSQYFGDGSMRQLAPLSPIHLGAERLFIVGAGRKNEIEED